MSQEVNSNKALVAYLDLLGYGDQVKSEGDALKYYAAIDSTIMRWRKALQGQEPSGLIKLIQDNISIDVFSDSFVIALDEERILDMDKKISAELIFRFFSNLISFLVQDCLRATKLLFRGAIIKGQHYRKEFVELPGNYFIFSSALVQAYEFAERTANYPRIIFNDSVLVDLDVSKYICDRRNFASPLRKDRDGLLYLNIYNPIVQRPELLLAICQEMTNLLKNGFAKYNDPPLYTKKAKWQWFATSHNEMISLMIEVSKRVPYYKEFEVQQEQLLITY